MCTAQTINQSIRVREGGSQTDREAVREAGRESGRQAGRQAGREAVREAVREAIPVLVSDHLVHQAWREGIYSDRQASVHGDAHTINSPRDGSSDGYCFLLGMQGDVGGAFREVHCPVDRHGHKGSICFANFQRLNRAGWQAVRIFHQGINAQGKGM